jgi:hypothetical protein
MAIGIHLPEVSRLVRKRAEKAFPVKFAERAPPILSNCTLPRREPLLTGEALQLDPTSPIRQTKGLEVLPVNFT